MVRYENRLEKRINTLICNIDENPIINSDVPEESSYLGIKLRISEDGFQQQVQQLYNEFTDYLNKFLQEDSSDSQNNIHVIKTLSRLLSQYQNSLTNIKESQKRSEWRMQSQNFTLANPNNDYIITKRITYIREAHKFFFKMSGVQLLFLGRLIDYILPQVEAYKIGLSTKENNSSISILNQKQEPPKETAYYFSVNKEFTNKYDIYLNRLHEGLKDELKYIDCTTIEFKNLFRPKGTTYRKTPKPIIWLSGAYSHLAYFIKCLKDERFIPDSKKPSFNQIAKKLFYDNIEGKFFETKSDKSDVKETRISPYAEIKQIVNKILKNKPPIH